MTESSLHDFLARLKGLPCWYVSCGGAVGNSFQLAFGAKVPRESPLKNMAHPDEYRQNEGEANLLVWCSWRLDGPHGPLTSSDDASSNMTDLLRHLEGETVLDIELTSTTADLSLSLTHGYRLNIFCDCVGEATFDGNWELWTPQGGACVGRGSRLSFEPRDKAIAQAAG